MKAYYFGCVREAGHYLWEVGLRESHLSKVEQLIPWGYKIDSNDIVPAHWSQGEWHLHHKDGWTALGIADNTVDRRPGSRSVFIFNEIVDKEKAWELASQLFPSLVTRIGELKSEPRPLKEPRVRS